MPSIRVLVVDDHRDAMDAIVALLEVLGYEARGCISGEECLELAVAWKPHVFLLDLGMPMPGFEVARRIRVLEGFESAALIAWTAFDGYATRQRAREVGFADFIVKPTDPQRLRGAIDALALHRT
jgi:two-component system, OmpR family, response regulator